MNTDKGNFNDISWTEDDLSSSEDELSSSEDNPELSSNVCREDVRLRTFRNWPIDFIDPEDLAKNGFYYLGRGDEVKCAFCKVEIMRWIPGDDPAIDHQRWAPQCPLLNNRTFTGNIPLNSGRREEFSAFPQNVLDCWEKGNFNDIHDYLSSDDNSKFSSNMCREDVRLRTFRNWPIDFIDPRDLARNGFYYLGRGDEVRCVFCRVEIMRWIRGDDPAIDHQRWAPQCPLVNNRTFAGNIPLNSDRREEFFAHPQKGLDRWENETYVKNILQRMNALTPSEDGYVQQSNLRREEARLRTFRNWPLNFISPADLARNGFYYLGRGDAVRCAFCNHDMHRWEKGDDPAMEHQRLIPHCRFLRNPTVAGNIPLQLNPTDTSQREECSVQRCEPAHPEYASIAARLRTFDDWPRSMRQRPADLADAGFYYTGQSDKTLCFYCGGGLKDWESDDEPWEQHARWFSRCPYVRLVKGTNYVRTVSSEAPEKEENKTHFAKSKSKHTALPSSKNPLLYVLFLLLNNTLTDIYLELKRTIVHQGSTFGNWILTSMYSVTLRLMSLWSRSNGLTQEDWRGVILPLREIVLSSITYGNQVRNRVMHWSFIMRIISLMRILFIAFL